MSEWQQCLRSQVFANTVSLDYIYTEDKILKLTSFLSSSSASYSLSLAFES